MAGRPLPAMRTDICNAMGCALFLEEKRREGLSVYPSDYYSLSREQRLPYAVKGEYIRDTMNEVGLFIGVIGEK